MLLFIYLLTFVVFCLPLVFIEQFPLVNSKMFTCKAVVAVTPPPRLHPPTSPPHYFEHRRSALNLVTCMHFLHPYSATACGSSAANWLASHHSTEQRLTATVLAPCSNPCLCSQVPHHLHRGDEGPHRHHLVPGHRQAGWHQVPGGQSLNERSFSLLLNLWTRKQQSSTKSR